MLVSDHSFMETVGLRTSEEFVDVLNVVFSVIDEFNKEKKQEYLGRVESEDLNNQIKPEFAILKKKYCQDSRFDFSEFAFNFDKNCPGDFSILPKFRGKRLQLKVWAENSGLKVEN